MSKSKPLILKKKLFNNRTKKKKNQLITTLSQMQKNLFNTLNRSKIEKQSNKKITHSLPIKQSKPNKTHSITLSLTNKSYKTESNLHKLFENLQKTHTNNKPPKKQTKTTNQSWNKNIKKAAHKKMNHQNKTNQSQSNNLMK